MTKDRRNLEESHKEAAGAIERICQKERMWPT